MKIDRKKTIIYSSAIISVIIISIVLLINYSNSNTDEMQKPKIIDKNISPSISSGPLTILNSKFKLGENVFLTVRELKQNEVGKIMIFTPNGTLYQTYPFNGTQKADFNGYFKPDTTRLLKLCKPNDLVGNWTVVIDGTNYKNLKFEMLSEFLRGAEADIKPVC